MGFRGVEARVMRFAPWLLGASLLGHAVMVFFQAKMTMVDLLVYRNGSAQVFGGQLYHWRLDQYSDVWALPFTYPPFAGIVFYPLSLVPWWLVRWLWQAASVACLWWIVRTALRMIREHAPRAGEVDAVLWRHRTMFWTAAAIWCEPVRTTLNYGQVNLLLAAVMLAGLASHRPAASGAAIGVAAGVKLTPAVSGLYFLVRRRWAAAVVSIAAGAATLVASCLVVPHEFTRYWLHLLFDPARIGPIGSAINQSLRAALSRSVGHDVGTGPIWIAGVAVAAVLLAWALRAALRGRDALAAVLAIEFFTLLVSPISWSHHWVWVLPGLLWLLYGGAGRHRLRAATASLWGAAVWSFLISFLLIWQGPDIWVIPHPWWQTVLGWCYPALGLLTLVTLALCAGGTRRRGAETQPARESSTRLMSAARDRSASVTPPSEWVLQWKTRVL